MFCTPPKCSASAAPGWDPIAGQGKSQPLQGEAVGKSWLARAWLVLDRHSQGFGHVSPQCSLADFYTGQKRCQGQPTHLSGKIEHRLGLRLAIGCMKRLRISAISYLNTAPLMWDFEHGEAGRPSIFRTRSLQGAPPNWLQPGQTLASFRRRPTPGFQDLSSCPGWRSLRASRCVRFFS